METTRTPLSQDAALVIALVGTAIPFARSAEDEAERWLRAMRLQGEVGRLMQALGVGEAPLMTGASDALEFSSEPAGPLGEAGLERVAKTSERLVGERGAESVGTQHLLLAVAEVYGELFERVLYARGTGSAELIEHFDDPHPARSPGPRFRRESP